MESNDDEPSISDEEYRAFLTRLGATLERCRDAGLSDLPEHTTGLPSEQGHALGIFLRCVSLFDACSDLIVRGHVEASMIVGRSLLFDALTLRYMALQPGMLPQRITKWRRKSLRQELGLARLAVEVKLEDAAEHLKQAQRDLHEFDESVKDIKGGGGTLPDEKAMAKALNNLEAYWEIQYAANLVHPTEMGIGRLMRVRDDTLIAEAFVSPINLTFASSLLSDAFLDAAVAIRKLVGWSASPAISERRPALRDRLKELESEAKKLMGISDV